MANPASEYHRGEMDITAQAETFKNVMAGTKWGALTVAVAILFLTVWLCAGAGFLAAFITAAVVAVIGGFLLRGDGGH